MGTDPERQIRGTGRQASDQLIPGLVGVRLAALAFGCCAVEPDFMYRPVFGEQLEQLIQEILVLVVHIELERAPVVQRSAWHGPRNRPLGILAQVAVEPLWVFDLVEVRR